MRLELRVVDRASLVLLISGAVLAAGLAWLRLPVLRHPAWLWIVVVGVSALAAFAPQLAPLVAQAAVGGAALMVVSAWLQRRAGIRRARPARSVPASSVRGGESFERHREVRTRGSAPPMVLEQTAASPLPPFPDVAS